MRAISTMPILVIAVCATQALMPSPGCRGPHMDQQRHLATRSTLAATGKTARRSPGTKRASSQATPQHDVNWTVPVADKLGVLNRTAYLVFPPDGGGPHKVNQQLHIPSVAPCYSSALCSAPAAARPTESITLIITAITAAAQIADLKTSLSACMHARLLPMQTLTLPPSHPHHTAVVQQTPMSVVVAFHAQSGTGPGLASQHTWNDLAARDGVP